MKFSSKRVSDMSDKKGVPDDKGAMGFQTLT